MSVSILHLTINQNGPINSFNITYTGETFDTTAVTTQLTVSSVVHPLSGIFCVNLTGLQEFNNYTITVVAINGAGAGTASLAITQLTDQAGINIYKMRKCNA